jgi:serine/threonine protein phosphatase PrpC
MGNLLGSPVTVKETHRGRSPDSNAASTSSSSSSSPAVLEYAVSSMQGWRVHMEDAHILESDLYALDPIHPKVSLPHHALFAVFDGHGGTYAAQYAGRNFCRVLSTQPEFYQYAVAFSLTADEKARNDQVELLSQALTHAFVEMDREIAEMLKGDAVPSADVPYHVLVGNNAAEAQATTTTTTTSTNTDSNSEAETKNDFDTDFLVVYPALTHLDIDSDHDEKTDATMSDPLTPPTQGDSGSTACVVLITSHFILCANAGDSRAILSRRSGLDDAVVTPLSHDHKPTDAPEDARIRAAGGYVSAGRVEGDLAVSRGLGDFRFKSFDVVMAGAAPLRNPDYKATISDNQADAKMTHAAVPPESTPSDEEDDYALQIEEDLNGQHHANTATATAVFPSLPGEQKVSPIPDIIVERRDFARDEFVLVACDGIWDVQSNEHAGHLVSTLFGAGEQDLGLICEEVRGDNTTRLDPRTVDSRFV